MNINYETLKDGRIALSQDQFDDLMDIIAYDESKSGSKQEERFPILLTERLINGENPVRVFRKYRKMTQMQLSQAVHVSQNTISDIETGKKNGSLGTLKRLAEALSVDLDDLI